MARQLSDGIELQVDPRPGERLADGVYRVLRRGISDGVLQSGDRLIESDFAKLLGISRTPVREALRRLEADGILESTPHRGSVVVDLLEDAATVYAMRQRLEGLAARMAAEHITVPQLRELETVLAEFEGILDDDSPEALTEFARLNNAFHTQINDAAGSPRLAQLVSDLAPMYLSRQVVTMKSPPERRESFEGHRQILDALWERDGEAADRLVEEHLEAGKRLVLKRLAERGADSGAGTAMPTGARTTRGDR